MDDEAQTRVHLGQGTLLWDHDRSFTYHKGTQIAEGVASQLLKFPARSLLQYSRFLLPYVALNIKGFFFNFVADIMVEVRIDMDTN